MLKLELSLQAWNTDEFADTFKREVRDLDEKSLPLQKGLAHSSVAVSDNLSATILECALESRAGSEYIRVKAGLFYEGIIAGCNCSDDPSPIDRTTEYCEVMFYIDTSNAETEVSLVND